MLLLPRNYGVKGKGFKLPYVSGRYVVAILYIFFVWMFRERIKDVLLHLSTNGLQEILFLVFTVLAGILTVATIIKKYSLIPVLGVLFCAYLLIEIQAIAWIWFFGWMGIGLLIYFLYGYRKSTLRSE